MHVPFFVDDNTGRVLVDPRGAELDIHRDFQQEFNGSFFSNSDDAPPNVNSFLARHGVVTSNRIKVEEFCIKPKNSLFILGTLAENPGIEVKPEPVPDAEPLNSYTPQGFSLSFSLNGTSFQTGSPVNQLKIQRDQRAHQVIRLTEAPGPAATAEMTQQQKVAAALLKAGISSPAAWSVAGVSGGGTKVAVQVLTNKSVNGASQAGGNSSDSPDGFDLHPPVVLMKGTNNKNFLISWRSQKEVARSLGWKCTLMIWGGPVLALLSLYIFLGIENLL
jgi:hypothetical protein